MLFRSPLTDDEFKSSRSSLVPPSSPHSEAPSGLDSEDTRVVRPTESYPRKKRKLIQPVSAPTVRRSAYFLGSILVSNAWSTVRGTGYVKSGDLIDVERDTLRDEGFGDKDAKKKGKGKQATVSSMFKSQAAGGQAKKTKVNTIVRLVNDRGFGRLII